MIQCKTVYLSPEKEWLHVVDVLVPHATGERVEFGYGAAVYTGKYKSGIVQTIVTSFDQEGFDHVITKTVTLGQLNKDYETN